MEGAAPIMQCFKGSSLSSAKVQVTYMVFVDLTLKVQGLALSLIN